MALSSHPLVESLWPRRLHLQLIAMVSALLVLALSLLGGYTVHEQARLQQEAAEGHAASLARNVAVASENLIITDSLDGLEELATHSVEVGDTLSLLVLGRQAEVLAHVERQPGKPPRVIHDHRLPADVHMPEHVSGAEPLPSIVPHEGRIEAWHPVLAAGLIGWVRVEHDTRSRAEDRARIWRNTLVVSVAAVLVCVALLTAFLRRPMRALATARRFARQIVDAKGSLMPVEPGPVEVTELRESLNEASTLMCQQMIMLEHNMGELRAHEAQLAEQNDQLGAIFRLSQDGLVTFDRQERVRFVNSAFLHHTGLSEAAVLSMDARGLSRALGELAPSHKPFAGLDKVFPCAGVEPAGGDSVVLELAGDRRKVLSLSGQCSQQGGVSRVLYVCDVTRQHTLDEMKSEFLSMAAHELRTPMVSIFGFTELMLQRDMSAEQRQDLLGRVYRQSQSMVAILNELLDLARIEARRGQDFSIEPLDLGEVVQAVLADHRAPDGRAAPVVVAPTQAMPVLADRHKLRQAVLNILSNAYKYSPGGGDVEVRFVQAAAHTGPQRFGVAIQDHGLGLSPDHVARLGERFFRADKSGNIPGTGLGVSIVKELMDLMGGRMQVVSDLGHGTTVTLWL